MWFHFEILIFLQKKHTRKTLLRELVMLKWKRWRCKKLERDKRQKAGLLPNFLFLNDLWPGQTHKSTSLKWWWKKCCLKKMLLSKAAFQILNYSLSLLQSNRIPFSIQQKFPSMDFEFPLQSNLSIFWWNVLLASL